MASRRVRVALYSGEPKLGDVKHNLSLVLETLRRTQADLVVFPELFLSGYGLHDRTLEAAREIQDLEACPAIQKEAVLRGCTVVVGMPREGPARGVLYNSAFVVARGVEGYYDKTHLPTFSVFEEDRYFREGSDLPVFETPWGRIGVLICYDLFFPEVTKALALRGADLLVCISASPTISRRSFEAIFPARAIETGSFLLYTNICGFQESVPFWGGAQVWGPRGDLRGRLEGDSGGTLELELELDEVSEARARRPSLRDTRREIVRKFLESVG